MDRRRFAFLIFVLLLLFLIVPLIPDRIVVHMPKTGIVVDSETGRPMPHVIVIAAGWTSGGPVLVGPGGYSDLYRIVTFTDENGRYRIPSTWNEIITGGPSFGSRTGWVVTVFKPGYAVVGDEKGWEFRSDGSSLYRPKSVAVSPDFAYRGFDIEVAPIMMFKPTLNLKEASVYYSNVKEVGGSYFASTEPGDLAIRQQGYALFAPWVCSLDPQFELDRLAMDTVVGFSIDPISVGAWLERLDPSQAHSEIHQHPKYKAGIVCKIITNGSGVGVCP